jgi:hypothetical protein
LDAAGGGSNQRKQHADGGAFAGAILAQKTIHIALVYRKAQVVYSRQRAKFFSQVVYRYQWGHKKFLKDDGTTAAYRKWLGQGANSKRWV